MSDMIYKNEKLRRVLQQLSETMPAAAALLMDEERMEALESIGGHDAQVCTRVLALCAPVVESDCQNMQQWLSALCDRLSDNMFPDAQHPRRDLTGDERLYLAVLEQVLAQHLREFDPLTDVLRLPAEALQQSRVTEEYDRFHRATVEAHVLPLMRISREVRPFDPASHTVGVH